MGVDSDVVIVGAGLSGLATAFLLGRRGATVRMLEAGRRPGGVIASVRRDGALYELGPNSGLDTTPLVNELLSAAGVRGERIDAKAIAAKRYILRNGALLPLPMSPPAFFATRLFSWRAKLGLLREPFVPKVASGVEETVAAFVKRRLGNEFLDYAIEPFVAGIYAGDPDRLSVPAAFPRLAALEQKYGSLIRGQILGARERKKSAEKAKNAAASFSFRDGMQTLTDALARGQRIDFGVRVAGLRREADATFVLACERDNGERFELRARVVALAVPAYAAADIVDAIAPAAASALREIVYPPVATVAGCYRRADVAHPLDGFGFLAPRKESPPILGCLFSSSMFDARSDASTVLLTTFVGGVRSAPLALKADEEVAANVAAALKGYLGARQPLWQVVTRWPQAIPQYTLGHLQRMAAMEGAEAALPGLRFCANWRGGVSVADCIKSAHAAADAVGGFVGAATTKVHVPAQLTADA
jgi:oxygen-dependent protoporphyrinogen oxidase